MNEDKENTEKYYTIKVHGKIDGSTLNKGVAAVELIPDEIKRDFIIRVEFDEILGERRCIFRLFKRIMHMLKFKKGTRAEIIYTVDKE